MEGEVLPGMGKPNSVTPPPGYQQGTTPDGSIFYSTNGLRVAADERSEERVSLVRIQPNPAHDEVTVLVKLAEAAEVPIRLLDLQGRVQQVHVLKGVVGQNEKTLKINTLPKGMYAVEVLLGRERIVQKLLKE